MDVVKNSFCRFVRSDLSILVLVTIGWFGFVFSVEPPIAAPRETQLVFAVGAGLLAFILLARFDYFDTLKLVPRRSDLLLVLFAVPAAAIAQHTILKIALNAEISSVRMVSLWSVFVSLFAFGIHYIGSILLLKSGRKRRIVLDLLPHERASTIEDIIQIGKAPYFEILSTNDLKEHFLRAAEHHIDLIIISHGAVREFEEDGLLVRAHLAGIPILDRREVLTRLSGRISLDDSDLWNYLLGATPQTTFLRVFQGIKTFLEPLVAIVLGVMFAPIMVVLAALIKVTSPGPIFYRQVRTGYLGRGFTLVKFRSMRSDAEKDGPQWASREDNRVTRIGAFMRKTRLDELPQLWNVIRGEMSFVGPRPERPEIYRELKKEIPLFSMRTIVRPGITGWAQVCAGYAASVAQSRIKLEYDLFYIQNMSPRLEVLILVKTLLVAVFGDKAEARGSETSPTPIAAGNV